MTNSVTMPLMRLAPERFATQSRPASAKACSSIRQELVLPLVPVTTTVSTPLDTTRSRSGQIFRAISPGLAVPPFFRMRAAARTALHAAMAAVTLRLIG